MTPEIVLPVPFLIVGVVLFFTGIISDIIFGVYGLFTFMAIVITALVAVALVF